MPDEGACSWHLCQGWNDEGKVCLIITFKILDISDAFWFQTFVFFCIIIVFEVTHIWRPQKMTITWPSHFHHPQKWTIDLMFKIMKSISTWQVLRTPLPTPLLCRHHKCMFLFWFFKVWSVTCLNANEFWILWKFNQIIFCQTIKETKQTYIFNHVRDFLNNIFSSLCQ